jgi:DNA-binding GntR family transcriptional regulator
MLSLDFLKNEYQDKKTTVQTVAEEIAIKILTGTLPDSRQIVEQRLCEKYHISRTLAREVLHELKAMGVVEIIPNRGAFIRSVTQRDVNDYFMMKSLLYPQCVRWAIERIMPEELEMLEEAFSFMEFYAATKDMEKIRRVIQGFNAIIYDASHNKELERTLLRYDFLIRYANQSVRFSADDVDVILEELQEIFEAFKARDPELGYDAAQVHAYKSILRRK